MRTRTPKSSAPREIPDSQDQVANYTIKVITPIYGGGVTAGKPDEEMPIRAAAIRGQLRYWWRFLQSNREDSRLAGEALFNEERRIWGGMGDDGKTHSSKIFVRVNSSELKTSKIGADIFLANLKPNNKNGLAYALFSATQNQAYLTECTSNFNLEIRANTKKITDGITDEEWETVIESLRWWASFGGLGSRTRRGLGAVEVLTKEGVLLAPVTKDEAKRCKCKLRYLDHPHNPIESWNLAVGKLQEFRQGETIARNGRYGRSLWPEADTIREATGQWMPRDQHAPENKARPAFPRAYFGMPINFEFKSKRDQGIPATSQIKPILIQNDSKVEADRMASPLIVKTRAIERNKYSAIALVQPTKHIDEIKLGLKYIQNSKEIREFERDEWWPTNKEQAQQKTQHIRPMNQRGNDALTAFLNYFEGH